MASPKKEVLSEKTKREASLRRLIALARQLGPGAKLPRFLELREELGVGNATLAAVLKELEGQGVIVCRHGVGIYVSELLNHRNVVLLCHPAFFRGEDVSPFWTMLVQHARARAAEKVENFAFHFTHSEEEAGSTGRTPEACRLMLDAPLEREIEAGRVHGILGVGLNSITAQWIESRDIAFVAFAGYGSTMVTFDNIASVQMGVEALAARGCRRIALWSSVSPHHVVSREDVLDHPALEAFQQAVKAQGLPFDPGLVRTNAHLCPEKNKACAGEGVAIPPQQEQGRDAVRAVFGPAADPRLRPDGIVCTDDALLQGALPQFARYGIGIGTEVQIATQANAGSSLLYGYEDLLIRMEADPARLVQEMYVRLEAQMDGRTPEIPHLCLKPTLRLPDTAS